MGLFYLYAHLARWHALHHLLLRSELYHHLPMNASWTFALVGSLLVGCSATSLRQVGTIPNTTIECYAIKDRDFFVAGILLMCTQDGQIRAASGGAAPGVAGFVGSVVQGAGTLGAGLAVGSGIKALESINVKGQIVPDTVNVTGSVKVAP